MALVRPDRDSVCPLCDTIPEAICFGPEESPFDWCGMLQAYVCRFCTIELAIEFYQEGSRYFTRAARLLGVDVWECRRRYLADLIAGSKSRLLRESDKLQRRELKRLVVHCRRHLAAIERYLAVVARAAAGQVPLAAQAALWRELAEPAFGLEAVLPDLIAIGID